MKQIDEPRLEDDVEYRYRYLAEFIGFDEEDIAAIHGVAGHLAPRIPAIVDTIYEKLLGHDATARHFVLRQHGYDGPVPESLVSLKADDHQVQFRKEHLNRYLMHLIGRPYSSKMIEYLDMVGKIHTRKAGNKAIYIPLIQMNAFMGYLSDTLLSTIFSLDLDHEAALRTARAFTKLLWLQNDLTSKHYQAN